MLVKNVENKGEIDTKAKRKKSYKIGKTIYNVSLHFSKTSDENIEDKIKRLIKDNHDKNYT